MMKHFVIASSVFSVLFMFQIGIQSLRRLRLLRPALCFIVAYSSLVVIFIYKFVYIVCVNKRLNHLVLCIAYFVSLVCSAF